jgi:hypothetical protein
MAPQIVRPSAACIRPRPPVPACARLCPPVPVLACLASPAGPWPVAVPVRPWRWCVVGRETEGAPPWT